VIGRTGEIAVICRDDGAEADADADADADDGAAPDADAGAAPDADADADGAPPAEPALPEELHPPSAPATTRASSPARRKVT
jgi:hypothetical protein